MTAQIIPDIYFSIIIPVYNQEKYIKRAILSVLNQGFKEFEIIIINGGSTDKTGDIINEYANKDKRIIVVNQLKKESIHIARIDGVATANGKYILFLDGDDYFSENAFAILYDMVQKNPGYDFYEYGYIIQPTGEIIIPLLCENDRFMLYFMKNDLLTNILWNKLYDTIILKESFLSMEKICLSHLEDVYESVVIAFYSKKIMQIEDVILNYQLYSGDSTIYKDFDSTVMLLESYKKMIILVENFLKKNNLSISLDNLNYRLLVYIVYNYLNTQKNNEDKRKLYNLLSKYFNINLILEYLFQREEFYKQEIKILTNSKNYRLGKLILEPLRKIKRIIKLFNYNMYY